MCTPQAAAVLIVTAASTAVSVSQQRSNAKRLERHQQQIHEQNVAIAEKAAIVQADQLNRREVEERAAAVQEIELNARRAIEARGTATVAAGEAGAFGTSFQSLLHSFSFQESEFRSSVIRNVNARRRQFALDRLAVQNQQLGRSLQTIPDPVQRPDYLGAALRIAGAGAKAYENYTLNQ